MSLHKTEGIVLQVIKYQEHDQILNVLTMDTGLIKIFSSGNTLSKNGLRGLNLSLAKVEIVYIQGKNELHKCVEISILNPNIHLRSVYDRLDAALEMVQMIMKSQLLHKPAVDLYRLFAYYLHKLSDLSDPGVLAASFQLKVLKHEGLFNLSSYCSDCQVFLTDLSLCEGESYCCLHAPISSFVFTEEEGLQMYLLAHTVSFKALASLNLFPSSKKKIKDMSYSFLKIN